MKMLTLRLKPKTIFGLILIAVGIVVICITFYSNHVSSVSNSVMLETDSAREQYLTSLGWEFKTPCEEKEIQIPSQFNDTYIKYNEIQKQQGFDLENIRVKSQRFTPIISQIIKAMKTEIASMPIFWFALAS